MRLLMCAGAITLAGLASTACESTDNYASLCERDYRENRQRAAAAGALIGAAAGAAIDDNDARGAAIGAAVGGLIGSQISREDDPCGYGYGGYVRSREDYNRYARDGRYDPRYGYWDRDGRWREYR